VPGGASPHDACLEHIKGLRTKNDEEGPASSRAQGPVLGRARQISDQGGRGARSVSSARFLVEQDGCLRLRLADRRIRNLITKGITIQKKKNKVVRVASDTAASVASVLITTKPWSPNCPRRRRRRRHAFPVAVAGRHGWYGVQVQLFRTQQIRMPGSNSGFCLGCVKPHKNDSKTEAGQLGPIQKGSERRQTQEPMGDRNGTI